MTKFLSLVALLGHLCLSARVEAAREDWPALYLDERILRISVIAANLSAMAYENTTAIEEWQVSVDETTGFPTYEHPDYDEIKFYTEEPDQAIVAKKEGRCYLAFRGTNANFEDWYQNIDLGDAQIYKDYNDTGLAADRCETRNGFAYFLHSDSVARGRADLQVCVDSCEDPDDCLVITGHSQGGALSTLAAITTYSLNPIVVTFGQPPTADPGCPFIKNDRFYRYVNWVQDPGENDLGFDIVVYSPNWVSGSEHYGYNIMVGEDPTTVYYAGYGPDVELYPGLVDQQASAHNMYGTNHSYQSRVMALYDNLPNIRTDGSVGGTICEPSYPELCVSNECVEFLCVPEGGVNETCIPGSCESDSDCAGDLVCLWDSCAVRDGEVEPGCPCKDDSQCFNKDCITREWSTLDFICNPDTPNVPKINETCIPESCESDADCIADFVCVYGACATARGEVAASCPCSKSSECANRDCITVDAFTFDYVCNPDKAPVPTAAPAPTEASAPTAAPAKDGAAAAADGASALSVWAVAAVAILMQICLSY